MGNEVILGKSIIRRIEVRPKRNVRIQCSEILSPYEYQKSFCKFGIFYTLRNSGSLTDPRHVCVALFFRSTNPSFHV